jgi:SecD/SecF fusion protein
MEKQKRWQFYLILTVLALTLYNILPTIFYYTKPLHAPIDEARAKTVAQQIVTRVNSLENDAVEWLASFAKLLRLKPLQITPQQDNPGIIEVAFQTKEEADRFKRFLPKAGSLIPFLPAQLELYLDNPDKPETVYVERRIHIKLNGGDKDTLFSFVPKWDEKGQFSESYKQLVFDRAAHLALNVASPSQNSLWVQALTKDDAQDHTETASLLASEISSMERSFRQSSALLKRFLASINTAAKLSSDKLATLLSTRFEEAKKQLAKERESLDQEQKKLSKEGLALSPEQEQKLASLDGQIATLTQAANAIQKNRADLKEPPKSLSEQRVLDELRRGFLTLKPQDPVQIIELTGFSPVISGLAIHWNDDLIVLKLYDDVAALRQQEVASEASALLSERLNQLVINEIARVARLADETVMPHEDAFAINLSELANPQGFLQVSVSKLAAKQEELVKTQLIQGFQPLNKDLQKDVYPIRTYADFKKEGPEEQKFGFVIYAPAQEAGTPPEGFHPSSIYVIARGMDTILDKYRTNPSAPETKLIEQDLSSLNQWMQGMHFIGYPGSSYGIDPAFARDFIFEWDDYYSSILKASREDFEVKGSKRYAILPFTDVEQRIITQNKIDDRIQEDLLKWVEAYNSAQIDLDATNRYFIPAPTENPYWTNFKISLAKYFRGDDRKILKWGLDLSGGKTVRIGLRDHNNKPVTNPEDLRQAVNELYTRINKMGVSERTIRIENENIVLEFPGSQALSAVDLVKASAMHFHVVNEKFSPANPQLKDSVNQFLQNVWNEAVVTNRKDIDSIKEIAWQHLGGETLSQDRPRPISESAKILYENGLRLANPKEATASNAFNDTYSTIAMMRGDDFTDWDGQTHPLIIIFNNYALEGSSLTNIQVGYDPTEGNNLSFSVKRSYDSADRTGSPRDDFYAWTSQFAEDKIAGTPKEAFSHGRGWRMAVILNGTVISKPSLRGALRDAATITGNFTQREVNQLAADLKAGSLSFAPKILSEQNVSAELGAEERTRGIIAALVALGLVVASMVGYYRFAGLVASCAVLINILIMWGILQNLDAALTLPAIAGIVLVIAMAVDANVLVFERIREEFAQSGRIASAIQTGYRKAFSAIVDSNITTIIAALILTQFDSGPIKGFAVTLIVGILSSMFTALFMTRYFFAGWVQNPKNKSLTMAQFFHRPNFNFLKYGKTALLLSALAIALGSALIYSQKRTIFGMDFTGGYAMTVEVETKPGDRSYRLEAHDAILAHGASARDVQVRELTKPNQLRIQLGIGLEEKGQPFYQLPSRLEEGSFAFDYQRNPRIVWLVKALEEGGLKISDASLSSLENNWTVMSGQLSDTMRNNAIIALACALLSLLLYITFRFEFKYAVAATAGLIYVVIMTLIILALFHALGFLVQIDLQVIGAIMTIIGYSLNDTIIIFDRIREDIRLLRKMTFAEIINHALNVTLSRTVITSGITLLVLLSLVLLGGHSIFAFSLVMALGVIIGTLASLFITTPILLYLHHREEAYANDTQLSSKRA